MAIEEGIGFAFFYWERIYRDENWDRELEIINERGMFACGVND